ncbi:hypothetical protein JCM1841_006332 [Sporobolomyces salmonicolor]
MRCLFLPDNLSSQSNGDHDGQKVFVYGWKGARATVVAGTVGASAAKMARRQVQETGAQLKTPVELLGRLKAHTALDERGPDDLPFTIYLRSAAPPILSIRDTSGSSTPSIIFYAAVHWLEILSLHPLPLCLNPPRPDLARSSTPAKGVLTDARAAGAAAALPDDLAQVINLSAAVNTALSNTPASAPVLHLAPLLPALRFLGRLVGALVSCVVFLLHFRLPLIGSLKDWSAAAHQLHTRLAQALATPNYYSTYLQAQKDPQRTAASAMHAHTNYIRFWNTTWLFANDLIVGAALASFVCENATSLSQVIEVLVMKYVSAYLRDLLRWLNTWPLGVKLNDELATLVCDAFLFLSQLWEEFVLRPLLPYLPTVLYYLGWTGVFGGASLLLSFASDLITLLCLPFFGCYVAITLIYRWSLIALGALFNVFRGKKYNPLRSRSEPARYEVDALLLGTILFVTLIFLFPTLAAFYLAFASSRLTIVALQTAFLMAVQALNAFPLFALMLRFKRPARLPGGVQFRCCNEERHWEGPHLHLENQPLPLTAILAELSSLFGGQLSLRTQLTLLKRLCVGRVLWSVPLHARAQVQTDGQRAQD